MFYWCLIKWYIITILAWPSWHCSIIASRTRPKLKVEMRNKNVWTIQTKPMKLCIQWKNVERKQKFQRASLCLRYPCQLWGYFLIYWGPMTHTHFVQTAEPSRVAVRLPSPQSIGLQWSANTQTPVIPPLCSLCAVRSPHPSFPLSL